MPSNLLSPFPDWITLHTHCNPHGCRNGGRQHEPLTGVGYGTGTGGVSMLLRDDGAVFQRVRFLRRGMMNSPVAAASFSPRQREARPC
jgi:hypothetical protein